MVLAVAHPAPAADRLRAVRTGRLPGASGLGTRADPAARRGPVALHVAHGLRGDLHRGDQAARTADRRLPGSAVRVVAAGGPAAAAVLRAGRASGARDAA